tara:strand:- start:374 stop:559 length:186 start_codon:yes stop_codon:yes gene_type:complete
MYFVNFAKCSVCKQKKSVATEKNKVQKVCRDCNPELYEEISRKQKENWISRNTNNKNNKAI